MLIRVPFVVVGYALFCEFLRDIRRDHVFHCGSSRSTLFVAIVPVNNRYSDGNTVAAYPCPASIGCSYLIIAV
jgi:hypothetical protein